MEKKKLLIIAGIILIVVGIFTSIVATQGVFDSFDDPRKEAITTLNFEDEREKTIELKEGTYQIWIKGEDIETELRIKNEEGEDIFEEASQKETISVFSRTYERLGEVDIEEEVEYTFRVEEDMKIHLTSPLSGVFDLLKYLVILVFGAIGLGIGVLLMILIFVEENGIS